MGKTLKLLLAGVLSLLALASCSEDEKENTGNTESEYNDSYYASLATVSSSDTNYTDSGNGGTIHFKTEGGSVTLNVDCGCGWILENSASDLFPTTTTSVSVTVTAGQNTVEEDLSGTITFKTANERITFATVTITQSAYGAPEITVETNEWNFPAVSSTLLTAEIKVTASLGSWDVENTSTWLTVESTESSIILRAAQNDNAEERNTTVILTTSDGIRSEYETIKVFQDARANIILDKKSLVFSSSGESASVTVESNYNWNLSYDTSNGWFKAEKSGDDVVVTITANNDSENDFEGVITVTAGDGAENIVEAQITVTEFSPNSDSNTLVLDYTVTASKPTITLPITGTNCSVIWGDGEVETVTTSNPTHTYASAGSYVVKISGKVTGLSTNAYASSSNYETSLTAVEQWGYTGLTTLANAFAYCQNLKSIPTDKGGSFADVTTFRAAFRNSAIESIPDGLLDYATKVTTFEGTFYNDAITTIPSDLFAKCTEATDFYATFENCSKLSEIPAGLFQYNTKVTTVRACFYGCENLKGIPAGLFDSCTEIETFQQTFTGCASIASIPDNLFKYNTKATTFRSTFRELALLKCEGIPEDLFSNCPEVTSFYGTFTGCASLETVPAKIFANNTKVTTFEYLFSECSGLETIPDGLFDNCPEATYFYRAFYECSSLKYIPVGLFKNNTKATDFLRTFDNCVSLTGESAYDLVNIDGVETKIHLYERNSHLDIYGYVVYRSDCYTNDTGLTDYYDIPSSWGGGKQ